MAISEKRFRLYDVEQEFNVLEFGPFRDGSYIFGKVNPTKMTPHRKEDPIRQKTAINGYIQLGKVNNAPESCNVSWDRIKKRFYDALKLRADSGHVFILRDHNGRILRGRIKDFEFEEITATVPSEYSGSFTFQGMGSWITPLENELAGVESGRITGATLLSVTDSSKSWTSNEYVGYVVVLESGALEGKYRTISSNTSDTLTLSTEWTDDGGDEVTPANGVTFIIRDIE